MLKYEFDWSSEELSSLAERASELAYRGWPAALALIVPTLMVVAGGSLGAWLGASRTVGLDTALAGYSAAGAGLGLLASTFASHYLRRWFNRFSSFPVWEGRIVWDLQEDRLNVLQEGYDFTCVWDRVDAVVIDDGDIYIVIAASVFILPERAFATPADRQSAFEFMWERLSSKAQNLSSRLQISDEFLDFDS